MHRGPDRVEALGVLHDVDLADGGPVPVVAPVGRAQHPERRPVALGRGARDVRDLDAGLHAQGAAGRGWKSVRLVSMRPDVQLPAASRRGVMRRLPLPSRATLSLLDVIVSISPVPQLAGPPGYDVPVAYCQFAVFTPDPAGPSKSSAKTWVQPAGGGGAAAVADGPVTAVAVTARASAPTAAASARRSGRRPRELPEGSLMWGCLSGAGGEHGHPGRRPGYLRALSECAQCALRPCGRQEVKPRKSLRRR